MVSSNATHLSSPRSSTARIVLSCSCSSRGRGRRSHTTSPQRPAWCRGRDLGGYGRGGRLRRCRTQDAAGLGERVRGGGRLAAAVSHREGGGRKAGSRSGGVGLGAGWECAVSRAGWDDDVSLRTLELRARGPEKTVGGKTSPRERMVPWEGL